MDFMSTVAGMHFADSVNEIANYLRNREQKTQYVLRFQGDSSDSESAVVSSVINQILSDGGEVVTLTPCHNRISTCYIVIYKADHDIGPAVKKYTDAFVL